MTTRTAEHIRADIMQHCVDNSSEIKIDDEKLRPFALAVAEVFVDEVADLQRQITLLDIDCRGRMKEIKKET